MLGLFPGFIDAFGGIFLKFCFCPSSSITSSIAASGSQLIPHFTVEDFLIRSPSPAVQHLCGTWRARLQVLGWEGCQQIHHAGKCLGNRSSHELISSFFKPLCSSFFVLGSASPSWALYAGNQDCAVGRKKSPLVYGRTTEINC